MKTFSSVVIATLTMVGMASAQPKAADPKMTPATPAKGAPATPATPAKDAKAVAPAAPPAMAAPTPPAEIKEMLKAQAGTWKCTGTGMGQAMKATMKSKVDLDGFWIQDAFEGTMGKTKFKFTAYTTFDSASKKWRRVMVDNMGGQAMGTSDGLKDGKVTFNMDVMGMGQTAMMKDTVDMTDPKLVKSSGEMSMDKGKTWNKVYEMTCKK